MNLVLVAVGGAIGALARFGIAAWVQPSAASFPWGTLTVNVLGSFVLGFVMRYLQDAVVPPEWRLALTVGLLGAFTTFSTFSYEAVVLVQAGEWQRAGAYILGSVALALAAVVAGFGLGQAALRMG